MLTRWIQEAALVIDALLPTAGSTTEYHVLIGLGILGFLFLLFNISAAMGATMATPLRVAVVAVVGALLMTIAVVAIRLYLLPNLYTTPVTPWLSLIAATLVLLAFVAPLAKGVLSAGYFDAVFSLALSAAGAALVVVMVHAGFNAFRTGGKGFDKTHQRRDSINVLIDDAR
jgi:hypothetical protein